METSVDKVVIKNTSEFGVQTECMEFQSPELLVSSVESSHKLSRRPRRKTKVYTPDNSDTKVYCICKKKNSGWYIM